MSMTQPKTTLTSGQCAPLLHRSSPALRSTLPQPTHQVFLRRDLRQRADYFANHAFNRTRRHEPSISRAPIAAGGQVGLVGGTTISGVIDWSASWWASASHFAYKRRPEQVRSVAVVRPCPFPSRATLGSR